MKLIFFSLTILLVAINNNTIEKLTDKNYEATTIMIYRGVFSILMVLIFSGISRQPLIPNKLKPQLIRLLIDGISIWLLYSSYRYLSAGTVALFQRMDIPFLIILSVVAGQQKSNLQFYLSVWIIIILTFFIADSKLLDESLIGFAYVISSVLLVALAYFLVKKHSDTENIFSLSFIYSAGMIIWGILLSITRGTSFGIDIADLWIFAVGGLLQFSIVYLALYQFRLYTAEYARLPFIIGALATFVLEMFLEDKVFSVSHIGLMIILTGMIATVCLNPKVPSRIKRV